MSTFQRMTALFVWTCPVVVLTCGCGPGRGPTVNVSGKVTLDGEPVSKAAIWFTSPRSGAGFNTNLKPDGTFSVDIQDVNLGDTYTVCIRGREPEEGEKVKLDAAGDPIIPPPPVPRKYWDWSTSELTAKIDGTSDQTFQFELESE